MFIRRFGKRAAAAFAALVVCVCAVVPAFADRSNVDVVFDFLVNELGLNSAAACGVLGNIERESNFVPDVTGDNGTSYGICQWHDWGDGVGLFTELKNFCSSNGYDWHTLDGQLKYLENQLKTSSWYAKMYAYLLAVPNTADGAYDAGDYWCRQYERPANMDVQGKLRGELARDKYWPVYGNGGSSGGGSQGGGGSSGSGENFEKWVVGDTVVNVRSGPGTTYAVLTQLTPGTEVRITEYKQGGSYYWAKCQYGWCVSYAFDYVSGALFKVVYNTNCATSVESADARFESVYKIPASLTLTKYGYTFTGWEVDGKSVSAGASITVRDNVVITGTWKRDTSVSLIRGDANCDGKVNSKDVIALMSRIVGADSGVVGVCGDVNSDRKLNAKDVTTLMKYIVGAATFASNVTAADEAAWK